MKNKTIIKFALIIISIVLIQGRVSGQNLLNEPEALTYDKKSGRYFVSNYNGTVIRIEKNGKHTQLVTGQGICSGAHLIDDVVYANCGNDLKTIKGFNIESGKEVFALTIDNAAYLNDIVSDEEGKNLFVSDFNRNGGKIYKVNIPNKKYSVFCKDLYKNTCGMIYEKENNRLIFMAGSSEKSLIQSIDLDNKSITDLYTSPKFTAFDCLTKDNKGNYYVSSWRSHAIYAFDKDFTEPELVFTDRIFGPSGFEFIEERNQLAVPSFFDNYIDFIPVPASYKAKNLNVNEILYNSTAKNGFNSRSKEFEKLKKTYGKLYDFDEKVFYRLAGKLLRENKMKEYTSVMNYCFEKFPESKKISDQIFLAIITNDETEYIKLKTTVKKQVEQKIIDENMLNNLGYKLVGMSKTKEAIKVFKLNIKLFPNSANVYDSYAEACMNNGEKKLAIENYRKSLDLNPDNENANEKLKILQQDKKNVKSQLEFRKSSQIFKNENTSNIEFGDIDNDGDLDMVMANMGFNHSKVWINDGKGKFTDSEQKLTQQGHGAQLGDIDGDGDLDIFITCAGWMQANVEYHKPSKIYFNNGKGKFTDSGQNIGDSLISGKLVKLVDIDNDGDLDAHIMYYRNSDKLYLNNGKGTFTESKKQISDNSYFIDINGDAYNDLLIIEHRKGFKSLLNDGKGNFTDYWSFPDNTLTEISVKFSDIDNDNDIDFVLVNGNRAKSYPTKIYLNDGTGKFSDSGQSLNPSVFGRIAIGDLNGDNYKDIAYTNVRKPNEIWLNNKTGEFLKDSFEIENRNSVHRIYFEDIDSDGDLDIIIANFVGGANEIWINELNKS